MTLAVGSSGWVACKEQSRVRAKVVRVSPQTNHVVAPIAVSDGPASMAFDGGTAWVVNHRDTTLYPGMVWLHDRLWIIGRGTDLLQVSAADGSIQRTIKIGGSGIDLVAGGDDLWVPTRSVAV
jgi:hypothetical protein